MQSRSGPYSIAARKYIADGKLGEIHLAKVYNLKPGGSIKIGKPAPDEKPKDFDWDRWLGPAAMRPFTPGLVRRWYYFWDFCGGDMGNDSIHQLDLARMILGDPATPTRVSCSGGRFHHKDDADVPDTQVVAFEYDGMVMTFENTQYPPYMAKTPFSIRQADQFPYWPLNATRIELYGSKAQMVMGRHGGGWQVFGKAGKVIDQMYGRFPDPPHQENWISCIKSRKTPNADVAIGHDSALLVHLGNIALRTGNQKLTFDPKTERFVDNPAANKLVKRAYRKGYEIPDEV
jgi:predicted dehydrogenase